MRHPYAHTLHTHILPRTTLHITHTALSSCPSSSYSIQLYHTPHHNTLANCIHKYQLHGHTHAIGHRHIRRASNSILYHSYTTYHMYPITMLSQTTQHHTPHTLYSLHYYIHCYAPPHSTPLHVNSLSPVQAARGHVHHPVPLLHKALQLMQHRHPRHHVQRPDDEEFPLRSVCV